VVVLIYIPTNSVWGFLIPIHPGKHLFIFCGLNDGHSTRTGMKSWPGFDLHFHYGQVCWVFLNFLAIWTSSLAKPLFSFLAHFFIGSLILGRVEFFEICVYSGYQSLVICIASKIFSHSVGGLFNLQTISFVVQKSFTFR
jgi:hypothetical protein